MQSCFAWDLASQRFSSLCWSQGPQIWTMTVSVFFFFFPPLWSFAGFRRLLLFNTVKAAMCRVRKCLNLVSPTFSPHCKSPSDCSVFVSPQSVWPCRWWSALWAGSSWWWAGGVSVLSWPASSWLVWCLDSSSPPLFSSLLSVGQKPLSSPLVSHFYFYNFSGSYILKRVMVKELPNLS